LRDGLRNIVIRMVEEVVIAKNPETKIKNERKVERMENVTEVEVQGESVEVRDQDHEKLIKNGLEGRMEIHEIENQEALEQRTQI